jgi:predicted DNA-binding protein with PD1-like motif
MKTGLLHGHAGQRTFAIVLSDGDEAMASMSAFARAERITAAHFTAIGAFTRAVVAFFDRASREYRHTAIEEQVEVLSLVGDISLDGDAPKVHAHVVVAKADATAHGGHLVEGHVWPTLEIVLTETPAHLQRRFDAASGLALIDPRAPAAGRTGT